MSTRSSIIIRDELDSIHVYRHSDGYPDGKHGVLATLQQAFPFAFDPKWFEASDFAASLVAAWKDPEYKGGILIFSDSSWKGIHGDVEWVYVIEFKRGDSEPSVKVYDWAKYWSASIEEGFDPIPVATMKLSEAHEAGINWKYAEEAE